MIKALKYLVTSDDHVYESGNDRARWFIGNIARWDERQAGARAGWRWGLELALNEHIGEFDTDYEYEWTGMGRERVESSRPHQFLSHGASLMLGRYGLVISWRGREITGTNWDVPRWQLNDPEYQ